MALKHISLKLDENIFKDLKDIAERNERSVLAQVRWIVKQYILNNLRR
tara:strand:- start:167 stop:310 length:144 start_codon:yes stop_codon:yes gene_type:complete